jgi:Tol biopolymer transport system component
MLAAVLRAEPDWAALPPETPPSIRRLLRRCLEKDPERRLHDVADARIEIDDAGQEPLEVSPPAGHAQPSRVPWVLFGAAALVTLAVLAYAWTTSGSGAGLPPLFRFEQKTFNQEVIYNARFMPDGQTIVYSSALIGNRPEIFLLQPGAMAPRSIAPEGTHLLSVSADGELAVLTNTTYLNHRVHEGTLARMTIEGSPRPLIENVRDADWGPDGELVVVRRVSGMDRLEYPSGHLLYETTGYVSEPRVSADGSRVAFLDHPTGTVYDDRGWVKVVDREGKVEKLTEEYSGVEGLAWRHGDGRLVFSAGESLYQPFSVGTRGQDVSGVTGTSGNLLVTDVAPDGRWLAIGMELFYGVAVRPPGGGVDTNLSWLNQSWTCTLTPVGDAIAFTVGYGDINYSIVTRRVDGSSITTLGPGTLQGFSPEGRWVAGRLFSPEAIVLYPAGAGAPRRLERGPIESYDTAQWFPDGRSLLITGNEPASALRSYRQSIDGGPPAPVTPEGVFGTLSPRGDRILARDSGTTWQLYPLDGGPPVVAPGLDPSDQVAAWSPDGAAAYIHGLGNVPLRLQRVDLATGARTPSAVIGPEGEAGIVSIRLDERILDPSRRICYSFQRRLSTLYLVAEAQR